jgi:hypothetical protein
MVVKTGEERVRSCFRADFTTVSDLGHVLIGGPDSPSLDAAVTFVYGFVLRGEKPLHQGPLLY